MLGMNLAHGGHLTHGHPLNFSGKLYTIVPYGVRTDDERIDYDELARLAAAAQAEAHGRSARARIPRTIDFARIAAAAQEVGALVMTDMAHIAGLVATGQHPSPVPALRLRHHDHAQDAARPARRPRPVQGAAPEGARQGGLPRRAGRPADARHRRQGGVLQGGGRAGLRRLSAADRDERAAPRRGARRPGLPPRQRRHRQPPDARRRVLEGAHRQGRRGGARQGRASRSTRTRSRSTPIRRWSRAASGSARRR